MIGIGDVREIASALPGAYEQASYGGRPAWRTKPRGFTWVRDDPEALVSFRLRAPKRLVAELDDTT